MNNQTSRRVKLGSTTTPGVPLHSTPGIPLHPTSSPPLGSHSTPLVLHPWGPTPLHLLLNCAHVYVHVCVQGCQPHKVGLGATTPRMGPSVSAADADPATTGRHTALAPARWQAHIGFIGIWFIGLTMRPFGPSHRLSYLSFYVTLNPLR